MLWINRNRFWWSSWDLSQKGGIRNLCHKGRNSINNESFSKCVFPMYHCYLLFLLQNCPDAIKEIFTSRLHVIGGVGIGIGVVMVRRYSCTGFSAFSPKIFDTSVFQILTVSLSWADLRHDLQHAAVLCHPTNPEHHISCRCSLSSALYLSVFVKVCVSVYVFGKSLW